MVFPAFLAVPTDIAAPNPYVELVSHDIAAPNPYPDPNADQSGDPWSQGSEPGPTPYLSGDNGSEPGTGQFTGGYIELGGDFAAPNPYPDPNADQSGDPWSQGSEPGPTPYLSGDDGSEPGTGQFTGGYIELGGDFAAPNPYPDPNADQSGDPWSQGSEPGVTPLSGEDGTEPGTGQPNGGYIELGGDDVAAPNPYVDNGGSNGSDGGSVIALNGGGGSGDNGGNGSGGGDSGGGSGSGDNGGNGSGGGDSGGGSGSGDNGGNGSGGGDNGGNGEGMGNPEGNDGTPSGGLPGHNPGAGTFDGGEGGGADAGGGGTVPFHDPGVGQDDGGDETGGGSGAPAADGGTSSVAIDFGGNGGESGSANTNVPWLNPGIVMTGADAHYGASTSAIAQAVVGVSGLAAGTLADSHFHGASFWEQAAQASQLADPLVYHGGGDLPPPADDLSGQPDPHWHGPLGNLISDGGGQNEILAVHTDAIQFTGPDFAHGSAPAQPAAPPHHFEMPELHPDFATQLHL
jgi:hypothetical protein